MSYRLVVATRVGGENNSGEGGTASPVKYRPVSCSDELCAARQATRALGRHGQTTPGHPHSVPCLG